MVGLCGNCQKHTLVTIQHVIILSSENFIAKNHKYFISYTHTHPISNIINNSYRCLSVKVLITYEINFQMNMLPGLKAQIPAPYSQGQPYSLQLQQNPVPFGQTGNEYD